MAIDWWSREVFPEEQIRHCHKIPPGNRHLERSPPWGVSLFLWTILEGVTPVYLSPGVGTCPRGGRVLDHAGPDGHMVQLVPWAAKTSVWWGLVAPATD